MSGKDTPGYPGYEGDSSNDIRHPAESVISVASQVISLACRSLACRAFLRL